MNRENAAEPVPAEGTKTQQQARAEGSREAPTGAAPGSGSPPAERWVMATDHSALLPLIRPPRGWRVMTLVTLPLIGLGVIAYAAQMVDGLGLTGMSNRTPWSLYIANFVFFIGASAGGIVVASLAYALKLEQFKPVARLAEITALTCLTLATIFITLDVGRPDRLWHLLLYGNLTSPLLWDVTSITIYGVLAFSLVYFSIRADVVRLSGIIPQRRRLYRALALGRTDLSAEALEKDHRRLHTLALLSVPGAIAVHTVTAWILSLVKTQPGWHTAILGPMFIVSAVVCGIALTIVAAVLSRWALGVRIGDDAIRSLARILFFALPVLGYLLFAELITSVYPKEPEGVHVFAEMAFGRWGLAFWFTLCGLLGGFIVLGFARHLSVRSISYASAAVVLAVMVERWNIVVPALTTTTHLPYTMPGYTPTAVEIAITVAAYAGGVLAYLVLARILPMMDLTVEHEAHP